MIDRASIIELKKAIRAVDHTLRLRIIELLQVNPMTVTETFIKLRIDQSEASMHLSILKKSGFVNAERKGKYIYYSNNYENQRHFNRILNAYKLNQASQKVVAVR